MNSIILGLSLVSAAAAQVANGVSAVPMSAVYGAASSGGYGYGAPPAATYTPPAATYTPPSNTYAPPSQYTPPPDYSSFMSGGYKTMSCGYGYQKMGDGSCQQMSWVSSTRIELIKIRAKRLCSTQLKVATRLSSSISEFDHNLFFLNSS